MSDKATLRISGNARRKEILGFPKGPQPLGTLTLLARSSVLYLCEGDGVDRNACALIQLADAQLSIPAAKGYPSLFPLRFSVIVKRHHKRTFVCLSRFRAHRNLFGKLRNRPIHRFLRRRRIFRERQFPNFAHQLFQKFHLNRRRRRFFFVHVFLDILEDREKAKLSQWQSDYWTHMVSKYPDLERGESADKTDRKHIPPRVFKEMTHLAKQSRKIEAVMDDATMFNAKSKLQEVEALLERFIPSVERMQTQLDQYKVAFTDTTTEKASLKKEVLELQSKLDTAKRGSVQKKLDDAQLLNDYRELRRIVERIPPEILERAKRQERSAAASRCTR